MIAPQLALEGAQLGVWAVDLKSGRFENDVRDKDLERYKHQLIERFASPAVRDTVARLCAESSDGSPHGACRSYGTTSPAEKKYVGPPR